MIDVIGVENCITEVKKIAAMAEAYDVALAPHCPLGPIALSACRNVDAVSYNAVIQEQRKHRHLHQVTVRQSLSQQQQNLQVRQQRRLAKV